MTRPETRRALLALLLTWGLHAASPQHLTAQGAESVARPAPRRAAAPTAPPPQASPPALRTAALDGDVSIDGRFDERGWGTASTTDHFTQADPVEGAQPIGPTRVQVLAGPRALVIGVVCDDPDPAGIVSYSVRRDASLTSEDHVRIVLGPFMDGRSGYVFAVNPSGARYGRMWQIQSPNYSQLGRV